MVSKEAIREIVIEQREEMREIFEKEKIIEKINESIPSRRYELQEVYATLKELGYTHLAYLFEFPPSRPWNPTTKNIRKHKYTLYDSYAFPGELLCSTRLRKELQKLRAENIPKEIKEMTNLLYTQAKIITRYETPTLLVLKNVGKPKQRKYRRKIRYNHNKKLIRILEKKGFQIIEETPWIPLEEVEEGEPLNIEQPTQPLPEIDSYKFLLHHWINTQQAPKTLKIQKPLGTLTIIELYITFYLLGLYYLAYLFQHPPTKPWDKTTRTIKKHKYILYNTYAFPSNLLTQPPLQKETQKLYQWITNTSPTDKQFTKHTIQYLNLQAQYNAQKHGTPKKQQLPNTTTQLKTETEIHYHTIKQTAKHLKTLLQTTKQHKTNIITQLLED